MRYRRTALVLEASLVLRLGGLLAFACCVFSSARGEVPIDTYPECGEEDRYDLCPSDFDGDWNFISYIPAGARETVREAELDIGSGAHADKAWRTTTGQWTTLLAVGDSGVEWFHEDYVNKLYLNVSELPLPQDADGNTCKNHDCDGNGLTNVQDYVDDARVDITAGRDAADGVLDPSDLIYTFSDGVDDDGNGFIDDICGWDFFGRDNDPSADRTDEYGTHGSGVMKEAGAEGEDGDSTIGVCPNCALLPIRLSDTILSDGVRVSEGIAFAADSGASGISLAHGALTNASLSEAAVRYAWDLDMLVLGVAGDFNTYQNFYPAMSNGALYLRSSRSNTGDENGEAYSYLNSWNCNNFGPRLDLIAPEHACATGAAAMTLGATGLIASAGAEAGTPLLAGELYQLLIGSADDAWLTDEEQALAQAYPSYEGWDSYTGYGKLNVARAVEAVAAGEIPPVATIWGPTWFDSLDLANTSSLDIVAQVSADRSSGYSWTLEYGVGDDPRDWTEFGSGDETAAFEGSLGTLDLELVDWTPVGPPAYGETILERVERVYGPAVTVRLTVVDAEGLEAHSRVTVFVQEDPDLLPGFPLDLGGSVEASPTLADFDGDGVFEIVVPTGDGEVWLLNGQGEALEGWPVQTGAHPYAHNDSAAIASGALPEGLVDAMIGGAAVGDLDGDGSLEVVVTTIMGRVHAWHDDGTVVSGFPYEIHGRTNEEIDDQHRWENSIWGSPVLEELEGDGTLKILFAASDGRLYVVDEQGEDWGPYPVEVCHPDYCGDYGARIVTTPAVGDIDADGDFDLVIGSNETWTGGGLAYMYDVDTATLADGWPVEVRGLISADDLYLPVIGEGHPSSLSLADVDGDGDLEIANSAFLAQGDLLHHDGTQAIDMGFAADRYGAKSDVIEGGFVQIASNTAFGDLDGDGVPDPISGGTGTLWFISLSMNIYTGWQNMDYSHVVGAWSGATGEMLEGWPRQIEDWSLFSAGAVADVSGDGTPEVVHGSGGYVLHAWNAAGDVPNGWPKFTGHWLLSSPAVGDIDGDGYLDVVVGAREGFLWAWKTKGRADQDVQWQSGRHDPRNTANYETPLVAQAGPEESAGCGCGKKGAADTAWLLLPFPLIWWRRRFAV